MDDPLDGLDRTLSSEEPLVPSSGFEARVMEAVHRAAAAPPPLPFPWWRFAAGVCACVVWAVTCVTLVHEIDVSELRLALAAANPELGYAMAAIAGSLAVGRLSHKRRFL